MVGVVKVKKSTISTPLVEIYTTYPFQLCKLYWTSNVFGCSSMNSSEGEGMSCENVITAEQLEQQIQKSIALRTLIDRTLQTSAHDIMQENLLFIRLLANLIREIAFTNFQLEEDLPRV